MSDGRRIRMLLFVICGVALCTLAGMMIATRKFGEPPETFGSSTLDFKTLVDAGTADRFQNYVGKPVRELIGAEGLPAYYWRVQKETLLRYDFPGREKVPDDAALVIVRGEVVVGLLFQHQSELKSHYTWTRMPTTDPATLDTNSLP